jgi:hypothetical protein
VAGGFTLGVKIQNLIEGRESAVVHIGGRQRDIAQTRGFERAKLRLRLGQIGNTVFGRAGTLVTVFSYPMFDAFAKTFGMAKQKFRPTRPGGFSGAKAYIR